MNEMKYDTLELFRTTRRFDSHQIAFTDILVSAKSLYAELSRRGYAGFPCLDDGDGLGRQRLLLEEAGDFPGSRVALLLLCPCGDPSCGAVSTKVERRDDDIIWSAFGYEAALEEDFVELEKRGPFRFRLDHYRDAVRTIPRWTPRPL